MPTAETTAIAADDQRPLPGSGSTGWLNRSLLARMLDVLACAREGACIIELSNGSRRLVGRESTTPTRLRLIHARTHRRLFLNGEIGFGEACGMSRRRRCAPALLLPTSPPFGASYARTVKLWNKVGSVDVVQFCLSHA